MELPKLPIANTIRDQVYQLLKDEICDGRYEPGYWLQEKELAQRLEVSKAHLIRTFSRQTGISPARYIVRVRVEYAKLLLLDEDASITYVAEASGFANANYFAKVFRRETGMSPSEYLAAAPKKQEHPQMPQNRRLPW